MSWLLFGAFVLCNSQRVQADVVDAKTMVEDLVDAFHHKKPDKHVYDCGIDSIVVYKF